MEFIKHIQLKGHYKKEVVLHMFKYKIRLYCLSHICLNEFMSFHMP